MYGELYCYLLLVLFLVHFNAVARWTRNSLYVCYVQKLLCARISVFIHIADKLKNTESIEKKNPSNSSSSFFALRFFFLHLHHHHRLILSRSWNYSASPVQCDFYELLLEYSIHLPQFHIFHTISQLCVPNAFILYYCASHILATTNCSTSTFYFIFASLFFPILIVIILIRPFSSAEHKSFGITNLTLFFLLLLQCKIELIFISLRCSHDTKRPTRIN